MKRWMTMMTIILIFGIAAACAKPADKSLPASAPPQAYGMVGEQRIPFILGSYHWNNTIADAPPPYKLVNSETSAVELVGDELLIEFEAESKPERVAAYTWENKTAAPAAVSGNRLLLPREPGTYIYEVVGTWPQGDARYAFAIRR
ncbi:hypothetical protein N0M98_18720 [Paenibacillus doosanensis]|uniref:Proteinase inhibitor I42 chagasin domain-containing protein n=1 Tax=Paenibacillus konkukensis TaxID=2020716 RepID=A0ABY4RKG1_9BACL|nr:MULTISPECIES: hypothetical protein [Paenibacillus]MCS7462176.1 hypothetical protein [Paenibacillus doosanensis]UQZ82962.1 hypothetical protein SK3146_02122 [Paenibacillus konkukensis]